MLEKSEVGESDDTITTEEAIKDPVVLEFLGLKDEYSESEMGTWVNWSEQNQRPTLKIEGFRAILLEIPSRAILIACARVSIIFGC
jgi:predicted nuclease of restriction endonuclease-like (RecB) superfamily